jgi:hypothetical protein
MRAPESALGTGLHRSALGRSMVCPTRGDEQSCDDPDEERDRHAEFIGGTALAA